MLKPPPEKDPGPPPVSDGRLSYGAYRIICLGDCMKTHHVRIQTMDAKTTVACHVCGSDLVLVEEDKPIPEEEEADANA